MNVLKGIIIIFICMFIFAIFKEASIFIIYLLAIAYFIISKVKKTKTDGANNYKLSGVINNFGIIKKNNPTNVVIKCAKCSAELSVNDKFCGSCGAAFAGDNVTIEEGTPTIPVFVTSASYDSILSMSEFDAVKTLVNKEFQKAGVDLNTKLIPKDLYKRKKILSIVFCALVFIYVSMIFFHFPLITYIAGIIILLIMFLVTKNYNLEAFIIKQIKARPDEKISNIAMNIKNNLVVNNLYKVKLIGFLIALLLPLVIFFKPVIIYEQNGNNYGVRYYIYGLTDFTSATIPEKYNGKDVVSLRGNAFSNMYFLKKVNLPETIVEIRGQAFKNDYFLKEVNLPKKLKYLGGESFYNCKSLNEIVLPEGLTEIKGSTFENCSNLTKINIPDNVTRIGGHAFYGNNSLSNVSISQNSKLTEIGSSAFRRCYALNEIYIPNGVYVNERAFKESPTRVYEYGSNSEKYEYHNFAAIYVNGSAYRINEYRKNAKIQNESLRLVEVYKNNGYSTFKLIHTSFDGEKEFTLSFYDREKQLNENLLVEIKNDSVFNYSDRVYLDIYYN